LSGNSSTPRSARYHRPRPHNPGCPPPRGEVLAQLSLAQGDHDATQGHCAAAMQAADEAGDRQLRAWILSIQAMLAAYTNRHQDVIDHTNTGLEAAGQEASPTAVKLASLQARAW
jgi:hypothetical protein